MKSLFYSLFFVFCCIYTLAQKKEQEPNSLKGAWQAEEDSIRTSILFSDTYYMVAQYKANQFLSATGGTYLLEKTTLKFYTEFDTEDTAKVGKEFVQPITLREDKLRLLSGLVLRKIDDGNHEMASVWRIKSREGQDAKMVVMERGARKTLKLLTATQFQWVAMNTQTKEFLGTGGGAYVVERGKYTEVIHFFSRDNSRAGKSLSFDYRLRNGKREWNHSGLSSTGNKINEVWEKDEKEQK